VEFERWRGVWGLLSLPSSLRARDSGVFEEMKCLFSIAPKARKGGESPKCFSLKNSNRTLNWTRSRFDQMRPVSSTRRGHWGLQPARSVPHGTGASGRAPRGAERGEELIGRAARPVTCDRTPPVMVEALWTPTGRRVQRVRSLAI
jgi:hypothetical protein